MMNLQISLKPNRTFTDDSGVLRPLTDLHTAAILAMRHTATVKMLTAASYPDGDRLLFSEALNILRGLVKPTRGKRDASTVAREALGLLCMHGKVFTDGTTVWILED